jgi:2-aminoadipate transaminase
MSRVPRSTLNLSLGWPSRDLYPRALLQRTISRLGTSLSKRPSKIENYALDYGDLAGSIEFRTAVSRLVSSIEGYKVPASSIFLTAGAGAALDLVSTLFAGQRRVVVVERYSYHFALRLFQDHGFCITTIPRFGNGTLDVERFVQLISTMHHRVALIYLSPTFANPTGRTLPDDERRWIVSIAAKRGIPIVADEAYRPLSFPSKDALPAAMESFDSAGSTVITLGSCTKLIAPGLRVGWIQFSRGRDHEPMIDRLLSSGLILNGGALNHAASIVAARVLAGREFLDHLRGVRRKLFKRARTACASVRAEFDSQRFVFEQPSGGYYLWLGLRFPKSTKTADRFFSKVAESGLVILDDRTFSVVPNSRKSELRFIRISFGQNSSTTISDGISRLASVYRKYS